MPTSPQTDADLLAANLANLLAFFRASGGEELAGGLFRNTSWPHRVLPATAATDDAHRQALRAALGSETARRMLPAQHPEGVVLDASQARDLGLKPRLEQMLMAVARTEAPRVARVDDELVVVHDAGTAARWAATAAAGFGYEVPPSVVEGWLADPRITALLLPGEDGVDRATSLLFAAEGVAGLHMVAVRPEARRQGLARRMMHDLLARAWQAGHLVATLQASAAGAPLYRQLGFREQGQLVSYAVA